MMYECLTGKRPYTTEGEGGMVGLLEALCEGPSPKLDPKEFDPELCEAVEKSWSLYCKA